MKLVLQKLKFSVIVTSIIFLVSCGGGSDTNVNNPPPLQYTGNNSEAVITSSNASTFTSSKIASLNSVNSVSGSSSTTQTIATRLYSTGKSLITKELSNKIQLLKYNNDSSLTVNQAVVKETPCVTGSIIFTMDVDQATGVFSGSLVFNNCELDGSSTNGNAIISGTLNVETQQLMSFSMTFTSLIIKDNVDVIELNGTISTTINGNTATATLNLVFENKNTNEIFKIEDYVILSSEDLVNSTVSISGRLYHSVHGYVTIETLSPIITAINANYPHAGQVILTGASETAGNKATIDITFLAAEYYILKIDFDGDGVPEVDQNCNWNQACDIPTNL